MVQEWDVFARLENLEEKIKEIEQVSIDVIAPIVFDTFQYAFIALCMHSPKTARALKDKMISRLRQGGLNPRLLHIIEEDLILAVKVFEEAQQ